MDLDRTGATRRQILLTGAAGVGAALLMIAPAAAMLKQTSKVSLARTSSGGSLANAASAGIQRVFTCMTPRSADPSVFSDTVPGRPPSTAWIDGNTRGGRA